MALLKRLFRFPWKREYEKKWGSVSCASGQSRPSDNSSRERLGAYRNASKKKNAYRAGHAITAMQSMSGNEDKRGQE
jgi:hypothetical protein